MEFGAVIHLAALLPSAATSTEEAARLNRHIDDRVFRWAAARAASVIYASGTSVYGDLRGEALVDERASVSPLDPYLQAKADGERSGADIVHKGGGRFVALRICAPYGPRQTARTVLQVFVERALASEPLLYYGTGLREQAFTFASDAAAACLLALEAGDGCFNIAGSPAITMKDLATMVARLAGKPAHFVRAAGRPDPQEGRRARFDTRRAARELGWTPKVPLRDGLLLCLQARRPEALA
jgi:nucleoside-diphosphate-sugar epimerase